MMNEAVDCLFGRFFGVCGDIEFINRNITHYIEKCMKLTAFKIGGWAG